MNHEQRVAFQEAILNLDKPVDVESKYCVPRLADKTQKQEHFYNDTFKFSVCLPTKTGCTNWQRGLGNVSHTLCQFKGFHRELQSRNVPLVSLVKMGEKSPEELTDGEIFYDLDRYPKMGMTAERDLRSADQGYLTMVSYKNKVFTFKIVVIQKVGH